jgi:hypothetical protein
MCNCCIMAESSRYGSQHTGAVNARQGRGAYLQPRPRPRPVEQPPSTFQIPPYVWSREIAYRQAQQQVFNQQVATSHATSRFYSMATQPNASSNVGWETQRNRDMGGQMTPNSAPHPPIVHPQLRHIIQGPSFFEDSFTYHPEEAALYNPNHGHPAQNSMPRAMDVLTLPYAPINFSSPSNDVTAGHTIGPHNDIPIMPLVQTNVDTAQFDPVKQEDWRKASIVDMGLTDDEFATSPESSNDTSYGPFTPQDDKTFADFASRSFSTDLSSSFDTSGASMFGDLGDLSRHFNFSSVSDPGSGIGSQFGSQASHFGGLPSFGELPLNQGPFRGIDGLPPIIPAVPQGSGEHDGSGVNRATTKTKRRRSSEREEEAISREEKDQYLLSRREEGYTYKEIKVMGSFSEAESTLRGRVRVLTKDRCDRVRKPVWTDRDVCAYPF